MNGLKIFLNIIFITIMLSVGYFMHTYGIYIIASGSMEPTYRIDEMVIIKKRNGQEKYNVRRYNNIL